nr:uncharacterized protein At5g08430-like [Ipomoea trifida]
MEFGSGSNKMKVQNKKRKSRRNKLEFLGWGSKPLIEFLDSIGKESRQYSQGEVDAIKKKIMRLLFSHFASRFVFSNQVNIFNGVWQWIQQNEGPEQEEKIHMEHKLEFLGWGSKPLIEFLDSIGKESRENHVVVDDDAQDIAPPLFSLRLRLRFFESGEIDAIMKKYVACNNLIDPTYKRRILCDERLEKLFKKKIVSRKNVYHLLEVHFRENHVVVDDDAQDIAPPLFSLRLRLRFFESGNFFNQI